MSNRSKVRVERAGADEETFLEIFDLLLALHKEAGRGPLAPEKAAEACYRVLSEGVCFIAKVGKKTVGTIAATEVPHWYSDETFFQRAWFFVAPKHRKKTVAQDLMRAAADYAEQNGKAILTSIALEAQPAASP